jgi:hypothetical protein
MRFVTDFTVAEVSPGVFRVTAAGSRIVVENASLADVLAFLLNRR